MTAPVKKGTDTVYSEVRRSQQGMTNILLLIQSRTYVTQWERNQGKKRQETGSTPTVNICIVSERMPH